MADGDSNGLEAIQRHPSQRAGGVRNLSIIDEAQQPSASTSIPPQIFVPPAAPIIDTAAGGSHIASPGPCKGRKKVVVVTNMTIRNKLKQNQTLEGLLELKSRFERTTQDATSGAQTKLLDQSREILEILSSMQGINEQNETTIKNLQHELIVVTNERDDARRNSDKFDDKLRQERKSFADVSHKHKKELEKLKRKMSKLAKKNEMMERDLKVKNEAIKFCEVSRVMTNVGETTTKTVKATEHRKVNDQLEAPFVGEEEGENTRPEKTVEKMEMDVEYWKRSYKGVKVEADHWKAKHETMENLNDELMDKIDEITDENYQLFTTCQNQREKLEGQLAASNTPPLETSQTQDLAKHVESSLDLQAENDVLHHSMDDAIQLASDNIANFYEEKVEALNEELIQASLSIDDLFKENEDLRSKLESAEAVTKLYRRKGRETQTESNSTCI